MEWVKQSCRNSIPFVRRKILGRIVFCKKKVSGLIYLFLTVSERNSVYWHFFRQVFQSSFQGIVRKLDKFVSWKKGVFPMFPNTKKTLMQSSNFIKIPFTCPVQNFRQINNFCKVPSIIILGQFLKKTRTFGEKFLGFIMFFASLRKMFSMCPEERLMKLFPKQWVFPFLNTERKKFRIFGWCFPQVSQNYSFRVQRNILWKAFSARNSFSKFSFFEWWKFDFSWVFFQEIFQKFFFPSKVVFWGEICSLETSWN